MQESKDGALSTYFTGELGFTLQLQSFIFRHMQILEHRFFPVLYLFFSCMEDVWLKYVGLPLM